MKILHLKLRKGRNVIRLTQSPLNLKSNAVVRVQRCLVAWSLKNVREPNNTLEITKSGTKSEIVIPQGYYTFSDLKETLKQHDITIDKLADNRVSLISVHAVNLEDFGLLLGFEKDKSITANTLTVSRYSASLTNKLKDISVSSSLVDSTRVYTQVAEGCVHSDRLFDLSIDTTQSLNGDLTEYNLNAISIPCRGNFYGQEIEFYVLSGGHIHDYEIYLTLSIV